MMSAVARSTRASSATPVTSVARRRRSASVSTSGCSRRTGCSRSAARSASAVRGSSRTWTDSACMTPSCTRLRTARSIRDPAHSASGAALSRAAGAVIVRRLATAPSTRSTAAVRCSMRASSASCAACAAATSSPWPSSTSRAESSAMRARTSSSVVTTAPAGTWRRRPRGSSPGACGGCSSRGT